MNTRILGCLALGVILAFGVVACEKPDPLAASVEKNTNDRGGAAALAAVQAIQNRIQITEPTFQVTGEYKATREGKMRIDIFAGDQRVFSEAFDGEAGWQMFGDGTVADMSKAGEEAVRHGLITNLYGLNEMAGLGVGLQYVGNEVIDGQNYDKVDLTFGDGAVNHYFLDAETGRVVFQRDEVALHPDVDDTVQRFETRYSDFRTVGDVKYSFRSEKRDRDTGEVVQTIIVEEIAQNPDLDPAVFERPLG